VSKAAGSRVSKDSSNKVSSSDRTQGTKDTVPGKKTKQKQKLSHKILQKPVRRESIEKVSKNLLSLLQDEAPLDVSSLLEGMKRKRIKASSYAQRTSS